MAIKVKRGLRESWSKGQFTGGILAYGYKLEGKKVAVDNEQASVVPDIFNLYVDGYNGQEIADILHSRGLKHKGKPFLPNAIFGMLHNEKYVGRCTFNGETYTNIYPAIVPIDLFEKVQAKLEHNKLG